MYRRVAALGRLRTAVPQALVIPGDVSAGERVVVWLGVSSPLPPHELCSFSSALSFLSYVFGFRKWGPMVPRMAFNSLCSQDQP